MIKLELVPISISDIALLDKTEYKGLSAKNREKLVYDSERFMHNGEFFRFFLIKDSGEFVGVINMCGHGAKTISVAPEILDGYKNKGYATNSLTLAYALAKEKGFQLITADIVKDNIASINLHLKLGFQFVSERVSKSGKVLLTYQKEL